MMSAMLMDILEGRYNSELNRDNPLGMQGDLAEAYGALIRDLWSGYQSHLTPRKFKVGRISRTLEELGNA